MLLTCQHLCAQGHFGIDQSVKLKTHGNITLSVVDTHLKVEGSLNLEESTLSIISQGNYTEIGGTSTIPVKDLLLRAEVAETVLGTDLLIYNQLVLDKGNFNIQNNIIELVNQTSEIIGEQEGRRVYSRGDGAMVKDLLLDSPDKVNPGNLGLEITSEESLGITTIIRRHRSETLPVGESLYRSFEIIPSNPFSKAVEVNFHYIVSEAKDVPSNDLFLWEKNLDEWSLSKKSLGAGSTPVSNYVSGTIQPGSSMVTLTGDASDLYGSQIPSAFTPNEDGKNDLFIIPFLGEVPDAQVTIYNRWGDILYNHSLYRQFPWDGTYLGKVLPVETYFYTVTSQEGPFREIKGEVALIR